MPSTTPITIGSTSTKQVGFGFTEDIDIGPSDTIVEENQFQFNTLDKIDTFERTQGEEVSIAHGEQVSLGLDNIKTNDVQHNLFKEIELPVSYSTDLEFSPAHAIKLDGMEEVQTPEYGKAVQLSHYMPLELDRLKATVTQDNAISLLGADDIPDNHLYTERIRQNIL